MVDSPKDRPKRTDGPAETPKKLPDAFPEKFEADQGQKDNPDNKKRGNGARFHGSM